MFALLGVILLPFLIFWLARPKRNKNLPPGPPKWPLIGNVLELNAANPIYPHLALCKLAEKYGDVMSLKIGTIDACVITSYEAFKEILGRDEAQGRYPFAFATDRAFNKTQGLIWAEKNRWIHQRKFTVKGLREFGFGKLKSMDSAIQEEVDDMMTFIRESSQSSKGVMLMNAHDFAGSVVNILWCMVAGYKFPIGDSTVHKILAYGNTVSESTSQSTIYNAFPKLRYWFPNLTRWNAHMKAHKEYQEFVKGMIEKAREERSYRSEPEAQNFIEVFLDEIEKGHGDPNTYFTEEQLIVLLQDLFLAGSETTGTALLWAFLFIVINPRVQNKLINEINAHFPQKGPMSLLDLKKLVYLKAVLYEVYRMSGFVQVPPPRQALETFTYKGYTIPKDTLLLSVMHHIFQDKAHWGDPEVFRPERFLDESGTKLVNTEHVVIFGTGKRICMGDFLVWDAMSMYVAQTFKNFTISAIPGAEPNPLNPHSSGVLEPRPFSLHFMPI